MAVIKQSTDASVAAQINTALTPINSAITSITSTLADKANSTDVYTKTETNTLLGQRDNALNTHTGNSDIHITAQERETWDAKLGTGDVYTKSECDTKYADKEDTESDISDLQRDKAAANNVYTKSEIDASLSDKCDKTDYSTTTEMNTAISSAISGKMTGTTLDLRTDDGLYAAVKAIGQALGATIQE